MVGGGGGGGGDFSVDSLYPAGRKVLGGKGSQV